MKLAALYSGGKDSTYALHLARQAGHDLFSLVTLRSENDASYMFHYPNTHLADLLAEALGLPLVVGETRGEKEKELEDLRDVLESLKLAGAEGVCTGAVASRYQYERIARLAAELGLQEFHPLWQRNEVELVLEMLAEGFEIYIVGVAAQGLGPSWLGRRLDARALQDLVALRKRYGPLFKKRLVVEDAEPSWQGSRGRWTVKKASLQEKSRG